MEALIGTIIPGQSELGNNDNQGVLNSVQISRTEISLSDAVFFL